jgi:hypothetical protein
VSGPWKPLSTRYSKSRLKTRQMALRIKPSRAGFSLHSLTRLRECDASSDADREAKHHAKCCVALSAVFSIIAIFPPRGDAMLSTGKPR